MVGLVRIATKVIQGFIYLKLNYLSSGAPNQRAGFLINFKSLAFSYYPHGPRKIAKTGGLVFFSFWVLLGSSGSSGVLLVFFWCSSGVR